MTALAFKQPNLLSSEELAKGIKTNPSFIRKLAVSLSAAGLVESVRGKSGGLRFVKNPKEITLDQIYKAVSDSCLMAVPDKSPHKSCNISCSMGEILSEISDEIEANTYKQLAKRNLKDILDKIQKK